MHQKMMHLLEYNAASWSALVSPDEHGFTKCRKNIPDTLC